MTLPPPLARMSFEGSTPVSIPTWFTMDTKLGCLSVHLDAPQCFSAEIIGCELVTVNGFKAAYAIKDGAEGPRGWMVARLDLVVRKEERSGFREAHVASIDVKIIMKKQ
ncbi:hypothetical protein K1719_002561 [Acacia pycnantha]|nr:hypothetical protein K1719_002561 [Acacia pycnantha]